MIALRPIHAVILIAPVLVIGATVRPARADFFDDARRTFTSDIPHFFQDDIPCAFGGRPTSHTRTSCKSGHSSKTTKAPQKATQPLQEPAGSAEPLPPAGDSTPSSH